MFFDLFTRSMEEESEDFFVGDSEEDATLKEILSRESMSMSSSPIYLCSSDAAVVSEMTSYSTDLSSSRSISVCDTSTTSFSNQSIWRSSSHDSDYTRGNEIIVSGPEAGHTSLKQKKESVSSPFDFEKKKQTKNKNSNGAYTNVAGFELDEVDLNQSEMLGDASLVGKDSSTSCYKGFTVGAINEWIIDEGDVIEVFVTEKYAIPLNESLTNSPIISSSANVIRAKCIISSDPNKNSGKAMKALSAAEKDNISYTAWTKISNSEFGTDSRQKNSTPEKYDETPTISNRSSMLMMPAYDESSDQMNIKFLPSSEERMSFILNYILQKEALEVIENCTNGINTVWTDERIKGNVGKCESTEESSLSSDSSLSQTINQHMDKNGEKSVRCKTSNGEITSDDGKRKRRTRKSSLSNILKTIRERGKKN